MKNYFIVTVSVFNSILKKQAARELFTGSRKGAARAVTEFKAVHGPSLMTYLAVDEYTMDTTYRRARSIWDTNTGHWEGEEFLKLAAENA